MLKEELEKMFDYNFGHDNEDLPIIKQFIFETIIPEVLKSVMDDEVKNICSKEINPILHWCDLWWNYVLQNIKQKAKELYNITL